MAVRLDRGEESASSSRQLPSDAQVRRSAQNRVGELVGEKYRLERLLGVGGMAAVFAAIHLRNGSRVAIKILHREFSSNDDLCARFLREGYLANRVPHPSVVHVLDDDLTPDGTLLLVMELVDGETLEERLVRTGGKLGAAEVVALVEQLLEVLAVAHERGIVHRDIKPDNVAITRAGQMRLFDFGVAREKELSSTLTMSGTVLGTPAFMAPEQAQGRSGDVDARSDLWSVGALAFSLLSGRLVHVGETALETLARAAFQRAVPLASIMPELPRPLAEVIDRALCFDRASRWGSAAAMRDALRHAWDARTSVAPPSSLAPVELEPARTTHPRVSALASSTMMWPGEVRRWRHDLRRSRSRGLLFAGFAMSMTLFAAGLGAWDRPFPLGARASHGLVGGPAPAVPDDPCVLLPVVPARAIVAARGTDEPAPERVKALDGTGEGLGVVQAQGIEADESSPGVGQDAAAPLAF